MLAQSTQPATLTSTLPSIATVTVDWKCVIVTSKTSATLQVVVNPQLLPGSIVHDGAFKALHDLGADYVRYVPWFPYPHRAVAELKEPTAESASWDFSNIDPTLGEFMTATRGHSVVMNYSTIPQWMYKPEPPPAPPATTPAATTQSKEPVTAPASAPATQPASQPTTLPSDPNQTVWNYSHGKELRDPSMKEISDYYVRLLKWYTKGGFTDENGREHKSGHRYKFAYWEVLNEIDFEHDWQAEAYTKFYDRVTAGMRAVDPDIKFVGLSLGNPTGGTKMFEYFLNPANHGPNTPLDAISYHFYASAKNADQTVNDWQTLFFEQADKFIDTVRGIEEIRQRLSPKTETQLNELGAILYPDRLETDRENYTGTDPERSYWNLAGAMFAHLYVEFAKTQINVIGESQLVGFHSQYPSVSLINYSTGQPNARYWVLKLLKDNFAPGDQLCSTSSDINDISAQAFITKKGKRLLLINKRNRAMSITLPAGVQESAITFVAPSTGDNKPASGTLFTNELKLEPFEVAVVEMR